MKSDVFSKLRLKLSISFMLVLALVLALLIGSLNVYLYLSNYKESERFMDSLIVNDEIGFEPRHNDEERFSIPPDDVKLQGDFNSPMGLRNYMEEQNEIAPVPPEPRELPPDSLFEDGPEKSTWIEDFFPFRSTTRGFRNFYAAYLNEDRSVSYVVHDFYDSSSQSYEDALIGKIIQKKKDHGIFNSYGYKIKRLEKGFIIVILDRGLEIGQQKKFCFASILLFLVSLLLVFVSSLLLSRWATKPVEEAFSQQKRFIADASHELKTPIAVIDANVDVLLQEYPDNKWLGYIKTENSRMSKLVLDMLTLAKSDAGREKFEMLPFDLANAAALAVLPFESVAFEQHKKLDLDGISKNPIMVNGDEAKLKQLIIILTDNAIKNSEKNALIKVSVYKEKDRCFVRVYNSGHGIPAEYRDAIFNRFYRIDSSRDRNTGGYGLGLSIAQAIANAHHGRIIVESVVEQYAEFIFSMPCEQKDKKNKL